MLSSLIKESVNENQNSIKTENKSEYDFYSIKRYEKTSVSEAQISPIKYNPNILSQNTDQLNDKKKKSLAKMANNYESS